MALASRILALVVAVAAGVLLSNYRHGSAPKHSISEQGLAFAYLVSLAVCVGVQLWTTFVFGLVAFAALPRRMFGVLQGRLFPAYFRVVVIAASVCLASFFLRRSGRDPHAEHVQFHVLLAQLIFGLLNLALLEPATTAVMHKKHKFEDEHGGPGVDVADLKARHARYKSLCKSFGMMHGLSSLVNLASLAAALVHTWQLALKLA